LPNGDNLQYLGNFVYNKGSLEYILNEEGKLNIGTGSNTYQFFVKDHLGNTRLSLNEDGAVEEVNHYYPFGMRMAMANSKEDATQKYRYNGIFFLESIQSKLALITDSQSQIAF
jgi:hypothetical protein